MLVLIVPIVVLAVTYYYVRWLWLKRFWAERGVPHAPPYPIVGSLTFILRENLGVWFRRIYDSFRQPYVGIWVFWRPGLIVNSPDIARNILIRDQANFRNRLAGSGKTDPMAHLNLFLLKDPTWSIVRKRLSPFFTGAKLRAIQFLLTTKSKELVQRINTERQKSNPADLRTVLTDFTTDIVGSSSFGVVSDATLTGEGQLRTITKDLMKFSLFRALSWCSIFFFPELVDVFRFKVITGKTVDNIRRMIRQIIAQRGGLEKKIVEPRDLLDVLIKIKQDDDGDINMTEDMMVAQAAIFLQAGFDTSALALLLGIYELAFASKIQDKLYTELKEAQDRLGENLLEASALSQLTYLNCVINETLRKHPGLVWLDRIALNDYKVDDQLTVPAGTPILVNAVGLHYDPEHYPEPDRFYPERFLPENAPATNPFTYMPFGEGPKKCIGQRLGLSTVRHGLTAVVLNYEIRNLPNTPKPADLVWHKKAFSTASDTKLYVEFIPRIG